tara:strand:+ start:232 stop:495 length:264 start_codon:yes stop_codon:yes gene_type:complete
MCLFGMGRGGQSGMIMPQPMQPKTDTALVEGTNLMTKEKADTKVAYGSNVKDDGTVSTQRQNADSLKINLPNAAQKEASTGGLNITT